MYASDWSADVVEQIWPTKVEFYGEDGIPDAMQVGEPATVDATISDRDLEEAIGSDSMRVTFDLDSWPVAISVADSVTVYQKGDVPYRVGTETGTENNSPLLLSFADGQGKVIYSSWRQAANLDGKGGDVIRYMITGE